MVNNQFKGILISPNFEKLNSHFYLLEIIEKRCFIELPKYYDQKLYKCIFPIDLLILL